MRQRRGILRYSPDQDRFCLDEGEAITSFHCGETLGIRIGADYAWGRMESDDERQWYIIFSAPPGKHSSAFTLRRGHRYDACVNW